MRNYIKEGWNKLPGGVKTGAKIVGALAVGAAAKVVVHKVYNEYHNSDNEAEVSPDNSGAPLEDVAVVVNDDAQEVIVDAD